MIQRGRAGPLGGIGVGPRVVSIEFSLEARMKVLQRLESARVVLLLGLFEKGLSVLDLLAGAVHEAIKPDFRRPQSSFS